MSTTPPPQNTKWKRVRVPEDLHAQLKEIAKQRGVAIHNVIRDLLNMEDRYEKLAREMALQVKARTTIDKLCYACWYCYKLVATAMAVRFTKERGEDPRARLQDFYRVCDQIESRLGVDLKILREVMDQYVTYGDKEDLILLGQVLKDSMAQIIAKVVELQIP